MENLNIGYSIFLLKIKLFKQGKLEKKLYSWMLENK